MPKIKLTVEKLDDVAEALRSLYVERDGKFELDAEGLPEIRTALREANAEAKNLRLKFKGIDPEEVATMREQFEELRGKSGTDALNALKEQLVSAHGKERDKLQKKIDRMTQELDRALVESAATSALVAAKGSPALLMPHVRRHVKVVESDDGRFEARVVDEKGNPRVRDDGTPMLIKHLVDEMRANEEFGRAFEASGAAGTGDDHGTGGGGGRATKKRSEMSVEQKADYVAKHGTEAYFKLPF